MHDNLVLSHFLRLHILHVAPVVKVYILQSIYDVFDLQASEHEVTQTPDFYSSLILIGHSLDENRLRSGFEACLVGME